MSKGFGRIQKRRQRLETVKDPLRDLNEMVPWEVFRKEFEQLERKERKSNAGRKAIDPLVLFKLLLLKHLYNLSNEQTEYQSHDRASFRRFLGLSETAEIADATTIGKFEEQLRQAGLNEVLFEQFEVILRQSGYAAQGGQIIDATIIPVPIQRNSREENQQIKQGEIPTEWAENPDKLAQKDTDARWTKKNGRSYFGYKDHISIDVEYGFIRRYSVSDASVHDSQALGAVLDPDNEGDEIWADSAYRGDNIEAGLEVLGYISQIHERAYRNQPLSEDQIASNRTKSKTRAKVEHVFGSWVMTMGGKLVRCIGIERVRAQLGLKNLTYNLKRYVFWQKRSQATAQAWCV
jgi:IS5 family transposase